MDGKKTRGKMRTWKRKKKIVKTKRCRKMGAREVKGSDGKEEKKEGKYLPHRSIEHTEETIKELRKNNNKKRKINEGKNALVPPRRP